MENENAKPHNNEPKITKEMLAPCGLFCGVCKQFYKGNCGGCNSNSGFSKVERKLCGIVKCCRNQGIARCNECDELHSCERIKRFQIWDSFVSHAPVINNLDDLNRLGMEKFLEELEEKVKKGEYPPKAIPGGINLKNLWKMAKPPFKPKKK